LGRRFAFVTDFSRDGDATVSFGGGLR